MSYNLGTEDIIVHDKTKKLNDGNHHVVRLTHFFQLKLFMDLYETVYTTFKDQIESLCDL